MKQLLVSLIVYWLYRTLVWTWRKQVFESQELINCRNSGTPLIFAHWHGDELGIIYLVKKYKILTMTSQSKDGQIVDYVIRKLGGNTVKGSSSKGAIGALKGLVRSLKKGGIATMAVDGPRGPLHEVKSGVFELAKLTGASIIPMGLATSKGFVFKKSWNKAQLPLPFSKVVVFYGAKHLKIPKQQDCKSDELKQQLKLAIQEAGNEATERI